MIPPDFLAFFVPFFFVLAVVYGALQFSGIFQNKAVMAIIAIVIGLFAASNEVLVNFIMQIFVPATMLFIVFFFVGFIYSIFKKKAERDYTLFVVVVGLFLLYIVNAGERGFEEMAFMGMTITQNLVVLIGLMFILMIFYAAYRKGEKQ
jgi:hypothetical protein